MERRVINFTVFCLIVSTFIYSQGIWNRLRVPIDMKGTVGLGYDNNFLRLSDKEIREVDVSKFGISSTLDSPMLKSKLKLIYSPAIIEKKTTNIVTSISYSSFTHSIQKSYFISTLSLELKLGSYSWIKFGIRDIPKYYLRDYHDRDLSNIDYYSCTFSSQKYYGSYSHPIKWLRRTWIKIYTDFTKEYYNSNFTEFDLNKFMIQADLNHQLGKKYKIKFSIAHGNADNISYGSNFPSTAVDRSYKFDKIRGETIINVRNVKAIHDVGILIQLEQRFYNLLSSNLFFDNWKYYLDGRTKVWVNWEVMDDIGIRTSYQFRWREASTQIYGDFDWVEDIKSYSKYEIWLEFSYKFTADFLY